MDPIGVDAVGGRRRSEQWDLGALRHQPGGEVVAERRDVRTVCAEPPLDRVDMLPPDAAPPRL